MSKIISIIIVIILIGGGAYIISNDSVSTNIPADTVTEQVATTTTTTTATSTPVAIPNTPRVTATSSVPASSKTPTTTPVTLVPTIKTYSSTEVSVHNSKTDCWSIVNGKVYNLTSWIDKHPGGAQAISAMCGKDGSAGFNDQHGADDKPANVLIKFYVGDLK
jgi:cytochrome b involved in lipid metabolism